MELGCGGSVSKFLELGHELLWIVFSTAEQSLPEGLPKDTLEKEFTTVINSLCSPNVDHIVFRFRVRHLYEHRQEILEELVTINQKFKPDIVVGPSLNDFHQDHQVVANEMIRAFKMSASIICYELPWNHVTFNTQLFIRLEDHHMIKKVELLRNYESQIVKASPYFSEQFIYGLASTRGVQCNSKYAEAFEVVRLMA